MPTSHTLRRLVIGAFVAVPAVAMAQPVSMPTQVADVLSYEVEGGFEHHSNIFRLPVKESDTVLRGLLGVRFQREVSLQRITAYANVRPTKYLNFSTYDYLGYSGGATWDWEIGRPIFGTLTGDVSRDRTAFDIVGAGVDNLRTVATARGLVGLRLTQSWSTIAAIDYLSLDNSAAVIRSADFERVAAEVGLRYAPQTTLSMDFVYRREDGKFPNRQVFDVNGNVLPAAIDNAYTQDVALLRIGYNPSDLTRLTGNIGYTRRNFENLPQRDFSGVTTSLDFERPLSGAFMFRASVFRTIDAFELLTASFTNATGFALRPVWELGGRTTLEGTAIFTNRRFEGDPGFVFTGADIRRDKLRELGLRLNYEVARRVFVYGELRQLERTSNYTGFDFTDNWVGLGVRAAF